MKAGHSKWVAEGRAGKWVVEGRAGKWVVTTSGSALIRESLIARLVKSVRGQGATLFALGRILVLAVCNDSL